MFDDDKNTANTINIHFTNVIEAYVFADDFDSRVSFE